MNRFKAPFAAAAVMALSSMAGAQNVTTGTVGTTQTTTTNPYTGLINQGPLGFGNGFQSSVLVAPGTNFIGPMNGFSNGPGPLGGMQNAQGPLGPAFNGAGPLNRNQVFRNIGGGTRFRNSDPRILANNGGTFGVGYSGFGYFSPVGSPYGYGFSSPYFVNQYGYAPYTNVPQYSDVPFDLVAPSAAAQTVPTDLTRAVPTAASRYIDARILSDGTLLIRWTGDPSAVRKVTFALLDSNKREIVTKTSTRLPIEARFSLTNKTDFYRVDVVYSDGAISSATKAI